MWNSQAKKEICCLPLFGSFKYRSIFAPSKKQGII